jgi:hypothetical protein
MEDEKLVIEKRFVPLAGFLFLVFHFLFLILFHFTPLLLPQRSLDTCNLR